MALATVDASPARRRRSSSRQYWWTLFDSVALAAGVAFIILATAASHGAAQLAKGPAAGIDRDVVLVSGTAAGSTGIEAGLPTTSLTSDDVAALGNLGYVPDQVAVAPMAGIHVSASALSRNAPTDVIGSTDGFARVLGYQLSHGRFLNPTDVANSAHVAVIGQTVVNALFAAGNPVGQGVTINGQTFSVVGTLAPKGFSGSYDQDNLIVLPITSLWSSVDPQGGSTIDQVVMRSADPQSAVKAASEAFSVLLKRHAITDPAVADFTIIRQPQLVAAGIKSDFAVRRILELAGVALLAAALVHLATILRATFLPAGVRRSRKRNQRSAVISSGLSAGLVSAALGVVAAVLLTPALRHLEPSLQPSAVTVYGAIEGMALGVVVSALAILPALPAKPRRPRTEAAPSRPELQG